LFTHPNALIDPLIHTRIGHHQVPTSIERSKGSHQTLKYQRTCSRPTVHDRGIIVAQPQLAVACEVLMEPGIVHKALSTFDNPQCQASSGLIIHRINSPYHIISFF
jgi:hypothetical protein